MAVEQELLLAGRILLGGFFAVSGLNHFMKTEELTGWVDSVGLPVPRFLVLFSGGQILLGGLGVLLGAFPVFSAGALITFLLVVSPLLHDFWSMEGDQKQQHMTDFMKNLAIVGGLLMLLAFIEAGIGMDYATGLLLGQFLNL